MDGKWSLGRDVDEAQDELIRRVHGRHGRGTRNSPPLHHGHHHRAVAGEDADGQVAEADHLGAALQRRRVGGLLQGLVVQRLHAESVLVGAHARVFGHLQQHVVVLESELAQRPEDRVVVGQRSESASRMWLGSTGASLRP
jgi:hypothetical protein